MDSSDFINQLQSLEDTRSDVNKLYDLTDIIFLTLNAVLSGATGWKHIEIYGKSKINWLRQYRKFKHGIPTRHSIARIISTIPADNLLSCFVYWANKQRSSEKKEHIAFDGKTLRGSGKNSHTDALHLMGAIVVDNGLAIYQEESIGKKNEIETMQLMLDCIDIKGAIISADAMHTQTKTAEKIISKGADYLLQVKDNQKNLKKEIAAYFHKVKRDSPKLAEQFNQYDVEGEHGRVSEWNYTVLPVSDWIEESKKWCGLQSIIEVERTCHKKEKITKETTYYISSMKPEDNELPKIIRNHWRIESHHWILDVVFKEDESQIYADDGAKNLALLRRKLAVLVRQHPLKDSIASKMKRASWDDNFRAEILFGQKASKV